MSRVSASGAAISAWAKLPALRLTAIPSGSRRPSLSPIPACSIRCPTSLKEALPGHPGHDCPNGADGHLSMPAQSVQDLVALIRANPGKHSYASPDVGTLPHLPGELFQLSLGLDLVHVPFTSGGLAMISAVAGHTPLSFGALPPAVPHVGDGRLRAGGHQQPAVGGAAGRSDHGGSRASGHLRRHLERRPAPMRSLSTCSSARSAACWHRPTSGNGWSRLATSRSGLRLMRPPRGCAASLRSGHGSSGRPASERSSDNIGRRGSRPVLPRRALLKKKLRTGTDQGRKVADLWSKLAVSYEGVLASLRSRGIVPGRAEAGDLHPMDMIHMGGVAATDALAAMAGIGSGERALDIGSGVGGPARRLASSLGVTVWAVELSEALHRPAMQRTHLVRLNERVHHAQGSAL